MGMVSRYQVDIINWTSRVDRWIQQGLDNSLSTVEYTCLWYPDTTYWRSLITSNDLVITSGFGDDEEVININQPFSIEKGTYYLKLNFTRKVICMCRSNL